MRLAKGRGGIAPPWARASSPDALGTRGGGREPDTLGRVAEALPLRRLRRRDDRRAARRTHSLSLRSGRDRAGAHLVGGDDAEPVRGASARQSVAHRGPDGARALAQSAPLVAAQPRVVSTRDSVARRFDAPGRRRPSGPIDHRSRASKWGAARARLHRRSRRLIEIAVSPRLALAPPTRVPAGREAAAADHRHERQATSQRPR